MTEYDDLLADPVAWAGRVGEFLRGRGFKVGQPTPAELSWFVDPKLRRAKAVDPAAVSPEQAALAKLMRELGGEHERFEPPALGPETESTGDLLADPVLLELQSRAVRAERLAQEYAESRSYRATAPARWVAGRVMALAQSKRRATAQ